MRRTLAHALAIALVSAAARSHASDVWEQLADDEATTSNLLRPGFPQLQHDLEGTAASPDIDFMAIAERDRHSYEARVAGIYWENGCGLPPCPRFDRVTAGNNVLTPGVATSDDLAQGIEAAGLSVRWIFEAPPVGLAPEGDQTGNLLRAIGDELVPLPAGRTYDVELFDTTMFVPRWNNSATQTTVFLIQNTTNATVTGNVYFHDGAGNLLATVPLSVDEHGLRVLNTAAVPGLAGQGGSAMIAQLGGYGAINGKAVALEPATGFTFDTAMTRMDY
jgi:hypothetical protein